MAQDEPEGSDRIGEFSCELILPGLDKAAERKRQAKQPGRGGAPPTPSAPTDGVAFILDAFSR